MNSHIFLVRFFCFFSLILATVSTARTQVPAAGTRIVNQAVVHYTDDTGANRQATTNEVVLFVQQVYSGTIANDQTRFGLSGSSVLFSHVLKNTGNGTDLFCLRVVDSAGDDGDFTRLEVMLDSNNDGEVDAQNTVINASSDTDAGVIELPASQSASLIVRGFIPDNAISDDNFDLELQVSSQGGTGSCGGAIVTDTGIDSDGADGTNNDQVTITSDAILEILKSSEYNPGISPDLSDDKISYTLTIRNIGASDAADILISDTLPAEVTFDGFGTHDGTFSLGPTFLAGDVTAEVANLIVGDEVVVRFDVNVDTNLGYDGAARIIENTAEVDGDLDGIAGREGAVESNTVSDMAVIVYSVVFSDIGGVASPGANDGSDDDGVINDDQHVDKASLGEAVLFEMTVKNTGNVTDSYNLVPNARSGWFTGAGVRFLNRDFATPLLDTTGDGVSDTGPIEPGDTFTLIIETVMPFTEPAASHQMTLDAVSAAVRNDGIANVRDGSQVSIGNANSAIVDIANSIGAVGFNDGGTIDADPASAITTSKTIKPGESTEFDLFIANEGAGPDVFALSYAGNAVGTAALSTGWNVEYQTTDGDIISKTPRIEPGNTFAFKAIVKAPDNVANQDAQSVFFITESFETGARDVKQDEVKIGIAPYITLTPDRFGQVGTCGFKEYIHVLRNAGGTQEDVAVSISSQSHLTSQLWLPISVTVSGPSEYKIDAFLNVGDDVAVLENGIWAVKALISDGAGGVAIPLTTDSETRIKVRVMASCETAEGTIDILTLNAASLDTDTDSSITDRTTVSNAQLNITKFGALDAFCDGTADGVFEDANVRAGPGECVIWEINLENTGAKPVCDVRSRDVAPSFTQFNGPPLIKFQPQPGTGSCTVNGSEFSCTVGNSMDINGDATDENFCLSGGGKAQIHFSVKID